MMSLQKALRNIVPPLTFCSHKGTTGRVGVIGGSLEYTGAPYFAAISAMKTGADLSHVFCPESASSVIKSYSPDLIVHPLLSADTQESVQAITPWLSRLHTLVIGPGLGRDQGILRTVRELIAVIKGMDKPIVIDADGLHLVTVDPSIVVGYHKAILTPNEIEFQRLCKSLDISEKLMDNSTAAAEQTRGLSSELGGVVVVRKGKEDIVSDGEIVLQCSEAGSPRRCGGQGDVLSGVMGAFAHWAQENQKNLCEVPPLPLAAYASCVLVKKCAEAAFDKCKRSMLASDLLHQLPQVFDKEFEQTTK